VIVVSESYNLYSIFPAGVSRAEAVRGAHEILMGLGGEVDSDASISLHSPDLPDAEMVPIENVGQDLQKLIQWPHLAGLDYVFAGLTTDVYYCPCPSQDMVCAIAVVVRSTMFDNAGPAAKDAFLKLGQALHEKFAAVRTIMGWGLDAQGFDLAKETERLRQGQFIGGYELLDLRPTPNRQQPRN
jgi:hypothetical protein